MAEYTNIETAMAIICDLCECLYPDGYCPEKCDWMEHLKEGAADVAPVVHGRWEAKGYVCGESEFECSVCHKSEWRTSIGHFRWCPFCGAKMDGDDDAKAD